MNKLNKILYSLVAEILSTLFSYKFFEKTYNYERKTLVERASEKRAGVRRFFSYFLAVFYRANYHSIEVENDVVLLDCFWGRKIGCNPYALYKETVKDASRTWKVYWVRNRGVVVPQDVEEDPNVTFVRHGSLAYAIALLKAKVLVCNSNF